MSGLPGPAPEPTAFDVEAVRRDFPILGVRPRGKDLAYLDNAASAQKPRAVVEAIRHLYEAEYANVHRGVHWLAERATAAYESARVAAARFLGVGDPEEVVFVRGTTEAINLVAQSFGRPRLGPGDEVLLTEMEHHSNIVPWQLVCEATGARLVVAPIDDRGAVDLEAYGARLGRRTRIVSVIHVSNALGTVNPVAEMVGMAHEVGATVMVDGAQAAPHYPLTVSDWGADFYAVSGHKMYGPTGIGVLWGRKELLDEMPPYQGGGEMIRKVSFAGSEFAPPPYRFEAGTPNIAGAVGLGAAIEYLEGLDRTAILLHENALLDRATEGLSSIPGVRLIGTAPGKAAVVSFVLEGVHPHDMGTILDLEGVAIRAGHHCAQPVMARFGVPATARASFALYNTEDEVDALLRGVEQTREVFR